MYWRHPKTRYEKFIPHFCKSGGILIGKGKREKYAVRSGQNGKKVRSPQTTSNALQ